LSDLVSHRRATRHYIGSLTELGPFWMCDLRAENKH
jgi:hypothetical protein